MLDIGAQRAWKRSQVQGLMDKIGGFTVLHDGDLSSMRDARANGGLVVQPTVGTDEHFGYRTKITPHYNAPRRPDQLRIGFQQRGSRTIVDIDKCIIASEAINSEYERQRRAIRTEIEGAEKMRTATLLKELGYE